MRRLKVGSLKVVIQHVFWMDGIWRILPVREPEGLTYPRPSFSQEKVVKGRRHDLRRPCWPRRNSFGVSYKITAISARQLALASMQQPDKSGLPAHAGLLEHMP